MRECIMDTVVFNTMGFFAKTPRASIVFAAAPAPSGFIIGVVAFDIYGTMSLRPATGLGEFETGKNPNITRCSYTQKIISRLLKELKIPNGPTSVEFAFNIEKNLTSICFLNDKGYHHLNKPSRIDIKNGYIHAIGFYVNGKNSIPTKFEFPSFIHLPTHGRETCCTVIPKFFDRILSNRKKALSSFYDYYTRTHLLSLAAEQPNPNASTINYATLAIRSKELIREPNPFYDCPFFFHSVQYLGNPILSEFWSLMEFPLSEEHIFMLDLM